MYFMFIDIPYSILLYPEDHLISGWEASTRTKRGI